MNCKIIAISSFKKDAKRLLKKYASLKNELAQLQEDLTNNPRMGTPLHPNVYKIRLAVKSKQKGKSGGLRIITYIVEVQVQIEENADSPFINIFLVAIYDKSEMENISDKHLKNLIEEINTELDSENPLPHE